MQKYQSIVLYHYWHNEGRPPVKGVPPVALSLDVVLKQIPFLQVVLLYRSDQSGSQLIIKLVDLLFMGC